MTPSPEPEDLTRKPSMAASDAVESGTGFTGSIGCLAAEPG